MRVFVAGGTGAIGRPLIPALVQAGHDVTIFTRDERKVAALGLDSVSAAVGDALDADTLTRALEQCQPEIIINQLTNLPTTLSPTAMVRGLKSTGRLRTEASATLARAARAVGARRVVAQSISFVYRPGPGTRREDDPLMTDAGGMAGRAAAPIATLEAETLGAAPTDGPDGVVLRYGNFYGPGTPFAQQGGAFTDLVRRRWFPVPRGSVQGTFGFIHLDDAVAATLASLDGPSGVYNVVDDTPAPLSEWVTFLASLIGAKPPRRVPAIMMRAGGGFSNYLMCLQPAVSNAKAKTELGWSPRYADWHEGFRAMFAAPS